MKQHAFALILLALLAATLFAPALVKGEVFTLRDHFDYFQPLRWFTAQELRAGNLPFWNPYNASGEAWLANPQTGVFYPPAWPFVVLPFATAYMLFLLFHLALLGCGAYLFFARTASKGAAMVGAAALMFSGPSLSLLDINNNLATFAWIPLALYFAAEKRAVLTGITLAMAFLGGEPFFAAVAALLVVIVLRNIRDVIVTATIAIGISAIQLFPFLELLIGSDRARGISAEQLFRDSMPMKDWLRVAIPPRLDATLVDPALSQHFIPIVYMSAIVIALAILGIVTRAKKAWPWLILIALAMLVGAGPQLLAALPLAIFRYPARVVPLAALAVAALAVLGWDRIRREHRWLDLLVMLVIVIDLLWRAMPLLQTAPFRTDVVPYVRALGADGKILRVGNIDPAHREAWLSGYLNLYDRRFDAYTAAPLAQQRYLDLHRRILEKPTGELLAALPAPYILTARALQPPFVLIARAANVTMYRYPYAWPMALHLARGAPITPAQLELGTSHARITVDAPQDGVVVVTQQDAPGWRVTVDGEIREKRLIFGVFRGVDVRKGRHVIEWSYRSRAFFAGAVTSVITLLAVILFSFVKRPRREKIFFRSVES